MPVISLPEDHNDTVECFKRHSGIYSRHHFFPEPNAEARLRKKQTRWLVAYLVLLFLAFWLIPSPSVKATVQPAPVAKPHKQLLLNFQQHLSAMKACAQGGLPVWTDKTTIQCLREIPNE